MMLLFSVIILITSIFCSEIGNIENPSLLRVFLTLPYDLSWSHEVHYSRVYAALDNFDLNPWLLFDDPICSDIVISQIILGYQIGGVFLESRSEAIIQHLIAANPPIQVVLNILSRAQVERIPQIPALLAGIIPRYINCILYKDSEYNEALCSA